MIIYAQDDYVAHPPARGHAEMEGQSAQDAVVDPTIEKLFALSNTASDRTASPIDIQSALSSAFSRIDEGSDSSDGHAAIPATETSQCGQADAKEGVADLLARAREGDSAAWEMIVRRYSYVVAARVRSFRLQDDDALDAMQMTWLRLAENLHRLVYPERLAGWLATTAARESLRILRQQPKQILVPDDSMTEDVVDPEVGPEQRVLDRDTAQTLWGMVARLPPTRRILLRALFADIPRSYTEVAHVVGIPVGSIGPDRARALRQLRWMLAERGLGPGA